MKKILVFAILCASLLAPLAAYAGTASEDLGDVYQDTQAFDGGPGSTINTSPAAYDASQNN